MIEKLKQKIQAFISSYVNSGLRKIVQSKVISCGAKMIYRSVNRIAQVALKKLVEVREKYDKETDLEKKNKKLVGIKLGSACLKEVGEALISGSEALVEGIE